MKELCGPWCLGSKPKVSMRACDRLTRVVFYNMPPTQASMLRLRRGGAIAHSATLFNCCDCTRSPADSIAPLLLTLLPPAKVYWVLQGLHCGDLGLRQYLSLALPLNCSAAPTALLHTFRLAIPPALLSNALRCQSFASACKPLPVAVPRAPCINQPLRLRMEGVSAFDRSG